MMNSAVATKAGHESKDLNDALDRIVSEPSGMQWLVVERDTHRIVAASYSMREARALMGRNTMVRNAHTGRIVAIAA